MTRQSNSSISSSNGGQDASLPPSSPRSASGERTMSSSSETLVTPKKKSVAKELTRLLAKPSNRICADCRVHLVDSSQTCASFSTRLEIADQPQSVSTRHRHGRSGIGSFSHNHDAFRPTLDRNETLIVDPASHVSALLGGGHGVFVCRACSQAHQYMTATITATTVKSVQDFSQWTLQEVQHLEKCGGNQASWTIYEGYIPEAWKKRRPYGNSSLEDRVLFVHAKYAALAFISPPGGPFAERAWRRLLELSPVAQPYLSNNQILSFAKLSLAESKSTKSIIQTNEAPVGESKLPNRFVDFFCIVGHKKELYLGESKRDLYGLESPEGLALNSAITDCYPAPDAHADMEFPEHISQFVFPDGCHASETPQPPTIFTFVLTSSGGHRLYGAALRIYDETMETSQMKQVLEASGYTVPLPWWLSSETASPPKSSKGIPMRQPSDIVFLPKCLVVISHYAFFNAFRHFLKQLYRISTIETPLPVERYIVNFASELPLPPQGKVEVKFGFTTDVQCTISRPAPNDLPLAKFSYRPLFASLSIGNVMVVVGLLMKETKVALVSKHYGLLTPCCEALLSFLFPFEWQGIYIPLMPYSTLDILDAPVPFLVGLHARYLIEVKASHRPKGIVFVDLDKDIVHLGFEEGQSSASARKRLPPSLPDRDASKLKSKLQEFADFVYLLPPNGMKGLITYGDDEYLPSTLRESYTQTVTHDAAFTAETGSRSFILEECEKAFPDGQLLKPIRGFMSEEGQLSAKVSETPEKPEFKSRVGLSKLLNRIDPRHTPETTRKSPSTPLADLHDIYQSADGFNELEIRKSFLRFFTSIFNNYSKFASDEPTANELFQSEAFLDDRGFSLSKREWLAEVLATQMFQRFMEERIDDPHEATILFFDESITAKNNRSKKKTLKQGRMTTPFLDDPWWNVSDSFTPPAPSNWGLPGDGRMYSYEKFPRLDTSLFGTPRPPKCWPIEWEQTIQRKGASKVTLRKRLELQRSIFSFVAKENRQHIMSTESNHETAGTLIARAAKGMNLSWAIKMIANNLMVIFANREILTVSTNSICSSNAYSRKIESPTTGALLLAHDIIVASRRKQGILLFCLVNFQAHVRTALAKTNFIRYKTAMEMSQTIESSGDVQLVMSSITIIQRVISAYVALKRRRKRESAAIRIQRKCKRALERQRRVRIDNATLIQRHYRGAMSRRYFCQAKLLIVWLQSHYRGKKARFAYVLVKYEAVKIQAEMRSYLTKKRVTALLTRQRQRYLTQVIFLWKRSCAPLSYRSQMWYFFTMSLVGHRMIIDELRRLWKDLEVKLPSNRSHQSDDIIREMEYLGISTTFEHLFLKAESIVMSSTEANGDESVWFSGEKAEQTQRDRKRLHAERLQVYERMDSLERTATLGQVYSLFGINNNEKRKKTRVLEKIWNSMELADRSAETMMMLFPELAEGLDIKQMKPGRKGMRRYGQKDALLDPLDKRFWVDHRRDQLFRKNMAEVALASMQAMPDLFVKLHAFNLRKTKSLDQRKHAVMSEVQWRDYKQHLIQKYLHDG